MEGMNKATALGCNPEDIYIFGDEGVSGAIFERPQLMTALDMLKKRDNNIKYFICYDGSRLSRNAAHQLIIIDEIKRSGAQLIFLKNNYEDNAEGRFQLTVMAAVDEYERARLKLRTEMGKRAKAVQHKLTHNPGLYGYDFDAKNDTLSINEEHAQNLRHMFKLLINEEKGPSEIAEELNEACVPSPRMRQWSRVTVRRILSNPSYLGTLYIRRYDTRDCHLNKFKNKGEKIKVKEKPQSEWVPIVIPQIIDKDTWEKAQNILKKSKHTRKSKGSVDFLLTPLLKCGMCGRVMNGKSIVRDACDYRYYICSGKYKVGRENKCEAPLVRADMLEEAIWNYLNSGILSYIRKETAAEKVISNCITEKESYINNMFSKKEKALHEKERIITMFQKGYINESEMSKKFGDIEKKLKMIDESASCKYEYESEFIEKLKKSRGAENFNYIIENMLKKSDINEKKHILGLLVSEINIIDNTISIKLRFG